ncbi:MAG: hypothetical protein IT361_13780 [Gemmatimonadaceae bacterium]|nr:hypothetical protein [Gemmatimonadaceae bacterium]
MSWLVLTMLWTGCALVLRWNRARLTWSGAQRWALALAPMLTSMISTLAIALGPMGVRTTESASITATGAPLRTAATIEHLTGWETFGTGVLLVMIPGVLGLLPFLWGVVPWPRSWLTVVAVAVTIVALLGAASIGVLVLPAAAALWAVRLGGPAR